MIENFKGKTAVLTGAGSGFGLECARIGAKLGMNLCWSMCSKMHSTKPKPK